MTATVLAALALILMAVAIARMTGWGQYGPQTASTGHDIAYIALTATLHAIGRADGSPRPGSATPFPARRSARFPAGRITQVGA